LKWVKFKLALGKDATAPRDLAAAKILEYGSTGTYGENAVQTAFVLATRRGRRALRKRANKVDDSFLI
jgi:hypothetical protein